MRYYLGNVCVQTIPEIKKAAKQLYIHIFYLRTRATRAVFERKV